MTTYKVRLNSIEKVKEFVQILSKEDGRFEFKAGKYVVDAKSIMGIFSLDLTRDLELQGDKELPAEKYAAFVV